MDNIDEAELLEKIRTALVEQAEADGVTLDEEQLDELSKKTLGSYVRRAADSAAQNTYVAGGGSGADAHQKDKSFSKAVKRLRGIDKASRKLTKEDVDAMISAAHAKEPVAFAGAFDTAIRAVIDAKVDDMRADAAASLFGTKE